MKLGNVIRKHRKNLGITQEEMANCLGVTTPAVNKWENDNTLPDVTLLAPIARLLGITTDELLSFKDELTPQEIDNFLLQLRADLEEKDYDTIFLLAKRKIAEYPNCYTLILNTAILLYSKLTLNIPGAKTYEKPIIELFEQCLHSKDEEDRTSSAGFLFDIYYNKEDFEMALNYTKYFSDKDPYHKIMKARVYNKTNKKDEAYKISEELLLSEYYVLQGVLYFLRTMYLEDNNNEMALKLANISSTLSVSLETGKHSQLLAQLRVACLEKNIEKTEQLARNILDNIKNINPCQASERSPLYQHIPSNDKETCNNGGNELSKIL